MEGSVTRRSSSSLPSYNRTYYGQSKERNNSSMFNSRSARGVGVLLACCIMYILSSRVFPLPSTSSLALEELPAFNYDGQASEATHLVVVAGHSVLNFAADLTAAATNDASWHLLEYQRNSGLPEAITSHIQTGVKLAESDPRALLVFSGGETRRDVGPVSEGASYYATADALSMWGNNNYVRSRTITEEYATDSFQNLLFSICRFREVTNSYPARITVVSFSFKKHRFQDLHAKSILWPVNAFSFVGIDPPPSTGFNLEKSSRGEQENAVKLFETDPFGCFSEPLIEKRRARNPFFRSHNYEQTCPEISRLLSYCGEGEFTGGTLPWS